MSIEPLRPFEDHAERLPPHNEEAEDAVLGSVLLDREVLGRIAGIVAPEDFYRDRHALVYAAMLALHERQEPIDYLLLLDELERSGRLAQVGGATALAGLLGAVPTPIHAEYYARIVANCAIMRRLVSVGGKIAAIGFQYQEPPLAALDRASRILQEILPSRSSQGPVPLQDSLQSYLDGVQTAYERRDDETAILDSVPTGLVDLDQLLGGGMQRSDLLILAARPSMGKELRRDEPVLTPWGWVAIGDLRVGDAVIGGDGTPCTVLGVYPQGVKPIWRVTVNDGGSVLAGDEHQWVTTTRAERKAGKGPSVRTTRQIRETMTTGGVDDRPNHQIPFVKPVHFAEQREALPLDPYWLGLYLGDGVTSGRADLRFFKPEADIQQAFMCGLLEGDSGVVVLGEETSGSIRVRGVRTRDALADVGLRGKRSWEKFIPQQYLLADIDARRSLLAGLLDTDGYVHPTGTGVEYSTVSYQLAQDVVFLARSLGAMVTMVEKQTTYVYRGERRQGRNAYRINVAFRDGYCPVRSEKHRSRWRGRNLRGETVGRAVVSVEPNGEAETVCIRVDSADQTFVTRDFLVTHNTAMSLCIIAEVAVRRPGAALLFTLEMPTDQITGRLLATTAGVDAMRIRAGDWTDTEVRKIGMATGRLAPAAIYIDDQNALSIIQIRDRARRLHARTPLSLIVVDHIQLIAASLRRRDASRVEELGDITRQLKEMARELRVPVVALSQLSRTVEQRANKIPHLADLRESGTIEQDGDVVLFLYREDYYNKDTTRQGMVDLFVPKHRNGPTGQIQLVFSPRTMQFLDVGTRYS
jgi:replicative DNA helicase